MTVKQNFADPKRDQLLHRLSAWFAGAAGHPVAEAELDAVESILPNLFGYHIVQLGTHVGESYIETSRISHALVVTERLIESTTPAGVLGLCEALPIAADTVDVLVMPHVLEFTAQPHAVLREAQRVLIGEGYVVITGFNPWSLFGCWRWLAGWRGRPPWCGRFVSAARLKDWLNLLGFEVEFVKKTSFRPPFGQAGVMRRLQFLELLGTFAWPVFGNAYVVVARKHVAAATPLKASWKTRRRMIAAGVAEPTARVGEAPADESTLNRD